MRIIGGRFKGMTIEAPRGVLSRPPLAIIRESVFNIIGRSVEGSSILDLYAGSGSLGIEGMSRGARHVHFVDSARRCVEMVMRNVRKLGISDLCVVARQDAAGFAAQWQGAPFDVIFIDPPFLSGKAEETLSVLHEPCAASGKTLIVTRVHWREKFSLPVNLSMVKTRKFGESLVLFLRKS
jgi:16S rRNA (guanine966-N2)-methyltransferase